MSPELMNAIVELSRKMLTMKAIQETKTPDGVVTERELIILALLLEKGVLSVSDIAKEFPNVSYSTVSTDITRLWRERKMVTKTTDPENQRITLVDLTDKGRKTAETMQKQRNDRMNNLYEAMNTTQEEEEVIIRVSNRASEYFDNLLKNNGQKNKD